MEEYENEESDVENLTLKGIIGFDGTKIYLKKNHLIITAKNVKVRPYEALSSTQTRSM